MSSENPFLPKKSLPHLQFFPAGQCVEWLDHTEDSMENYRRSGGHPAYGEHDITYQFNELGYRSIDFKTDAAIKIVVIGCSYVMGVGLSQKDLFHEVFAQELRTATAKSVSVFNLGAPGGSNDYIARLLHLAVPLFDPTIVLVNFTHASRREYVSVSNALLTYVPGYRPDNLVAREIYKHLDSLTSPVDNDLNLFRNYKSIEALLYGRIWLFSSISATDFERIGDHVDATKYVGAMPQIDRGRDKCHPGPGSHRVLASCYWDRFVSARHLERINKE